MSTKQVNLSSFYFSQHVQKESKEMEHQILLFDNQNESTDVNYNDILNNNQSLKNECDELLTSL